MSVPAEDKGSDATQVAYDQILHKIVTGDLPGGERVREQALAESTGVSRTPVRQALNRLSAEGLISIAPNRGATVVQFTEDDITGILDLRARFESYAVGLAVPNLTPEDLEQLQSLAGEMEDLVTEGTLRAADLGTLNNRFHRVFVDACGNRQLASIIETLIRPIMVIRTFEQYTPEALQRSMHHHAELIEAARAGDGQWAESVMHSHIRAARHAHRKLV